MAKRMNIIEEVELTISHAENAKLQESAAATSVPTRIVTIVEGIHSGLTKNDTFYPSETLQASRLSWISPYNKPVIKNHDVHTEPLGRVLSSTYKQSNISPDKQTLELELEITDEDTIRKVLDGRYRTLSIGGSSGSVACSICAADQVKEGYCGHDKGRVYEGKKAYWIISDLAFDEISWVNVPADVHAQVVNRDASEYEMTESQRGGSNLDKNQDNVLDQIDALRQKESEETEPETKVTEGEENTTEPETVEPEVVEPEKEEPTEEPEVKTVEEQLEEATTRIVELESENTTLVAERDTFKEQVVQLEEEVATMKEQVTVLNRNNEDSKNEKDVLVKQNTTLATYTHKVLAENLASFQVVLGKVEEDKKDETVKTLVKETSRSLREKISELSKERPQRQIEHVEKPTGEVDVTESTKKQEEEKEFTLQDFAKALGGALNKK